MKTIVFDPSKHRIIQATEERDTEILLSKEDNMLGEVVIIQIPPAICYAFDQVTPQDMYFIEAQLDGTHTARRIL